MHDGGVDQRDDQSIEDMADQAAHQAHYATIEHQHAGRLHGPRFDTGVHDGYPAQHQPDDDEVDGAKEDTPD